MVRRKMENNNLFLSSFFTLLLGFCHVSSASERKTYVVHMDKSQIPASFTDDDHTKWFRSSLRSVSDSAEMLYTYNNVLHGFSTRLTPQEARILMTRPEILSVLPELKYELHTTRTPYFLGVDKVTEFFPESNSVSEVVIGVLDTGVWPESKSFDDTGLGPIPNSWKGTCEVISCNLKLIGANYFSKGYEAAFGPIDGSKESISPRDDEGHGTHTASTAVGSHVTNASLFSYAAGAARGMATRAWLSIYKVCWIGGCFGSDILAAIDKAIDDGVNVLSLSLGGGMYDYYKDNVAIGAFAAMEKGILVSCSAGNAGPSSYSLSNTAPWITTVGAGTLDRDFPAYVILGDGKNLFGVSLYNGESLPSGKMFPFVYAGNVSNVVNGNLCMTSTLIPEKVEGKIVLCDRGINARAQKGAVVKAAGGVGMVLANTVANGEELVADAHLLPATSVGETNGDAIKYYMFSNPNPTVTILFGGTQVGIEPSPIVAAFSSRGPNSITPEILKPDIIAPGVNIIAGWTGKVGPTSLLEDTRRVEFNIISGTSMSCPHVSGLMALLKAAHPDWSPAAIRSALMTTAYTAYKTGDPIQDVATEKPSTPFDHGAGHVDPVAALDPGLVYDLNMEDYLNFLCALDYTSSQISRLARSIFTCDPSKNYSVTHLNYPSFAVNLQPQMGVNIVKYSRTLTNVGPGGTYKVYVSVPNETVKISVEPKELVFSEKNEKKSYTVTFSSSNSNAPNSNVFGRIEWSNEKHRVGSPVAITWS